MREHEFNLSDDELALLDRLAAGNGEYGSLMKELKIQRQGLVQRMDAGQLRRFVALDGRLPRTLHDLAVRLAELMDTGS